MKTALNPLEGMSPALRQAFERDIEVARERLSKARTALQISSVPLLAMATIEPLAQQVNRKAGIACKDGCAWCCRGLKVEVSAPEAIAIAEAIRMTTEPDALSTISEGLKVAAVHSRALSAEARWAEHTPCHFLNQSTNACTIYEFRPFSCRSHTSVDVAACETAYADQSGTSGVPVIMPSRQMYSGARMAQHTATEELGLDARSFELLSAVAFAFREPDAGARWRAGERVFDAAVLPSDEADRARAQAGLERWGVVPPDRLLAKKRPQTPNEKKRERRAQKRK